MLEKKLKDEELLSKSFVKNSIQSYKILQPFLTYLNKSISR
ncbi:hypothetical protein LEP1GSC100_3646 [Leptospira interrogans serovar Bataviae str. UI 08561]|nr:hypothetical protein LEP1GSC100_3646 [Leptospira interrogans serovar Bataviae str. UI 08561]